MFRKCSSIFIFLVSFLVLSSFHKNDTALPPAKKFVIVLDAGHGGHDPGNLGNGYLEKDIALSIVKKVGALLAKNKDVKVVYTREDDVFIGLQQRGKIANEAKADLFVSVHCNAHKSDASGTETFILGGNQGNERNFEVAKKENSVIYLEDNYEIKYGEYDINSPESVIGLTIMQEEFLEQSLQIAGLVQGAFKQKLKRKDRGPKQAGFIVLHQTFMPSILIEVGFLTNKDEGAYLNSNKGQDEISSTISQAIIDYKNGVEAGSVELNTPPEETEIVEVKTEEVIPEATNEVVETKKPVVETKSPVVEAKKTVAEKKDPIVETKLPEGNPINVTVEEPENVTQTQVAEQEAPKEITNPETELPNKIRSKVEEPVIAGHGVTFKIQIMATTEVIPLDGKFFRGLNTLSKEPFKNLYRYMYGMADTYQKAKLLKSNADAKGYTDSYVVSYKDGERIPLWKALKLVSNE